MPWFIQDETPFLSFPLDGVLRRAGVPFHGPDELSCTWIRVFSAINSIILKAYWKPWSLVWWAMERSSSTKSWVPSASVCQWWAMERSLPTMSWVPSASACQWWAMERSLLTTSWVPSALAHHGSSSPYFQMTSSVNYNFDDAAGLNDHQ